MELISLSFCSKIKEVSPVDEKSSPTSRFWKEDIKIAREYNKTIRERKRSLHQDLLVEWAVRI